MGPGILSHIIYFSQKIHNNFTTVLLGEDRVLVDALTFPGGRRPRYKQCSSQTFLCIFMLWFSSLVTFARAIYCWFVPLGWPWRGSWWPDWGKQLQGRVFSHHPSVRYHCFTKVVKSKNIKVPTLWAEVRLVFQHSLPWELALPCSQLWHGTPWKGFPEKLNKAELSKQKGVYGGSLTAGRDQGGRCASSRCIPAHLSMSLVHRSACTRSPLWCHHGATEMPAASMKCKQIHNCPSIYTHLDEKKKKKISRRRKNGW